MWLSLKIYTKVFSNDLYESLNILTSSSTVFMTHMRANSIAVSYAAQIVMIIFIHQNVRNMLSVVLAPCSMFNCGTQNAADVLLSEAFDPSVYM